jgi:hypothetical protein
MGGKKVLPSLEARAPADAPGDGSDADEAGIAVEGLAERLAKMVARVDDSAACEPASTTVCSTTAGWAGRADFCPGGVRPGLHVHGTERHGGSMNEYRYDVEVYAEGEAP